MICPRCDTQTSISICSIFNRDHICLACEAIEQLHPGYKAARSEELKQVLAHNYKFPGVGLPADYTVFSSAHIVHAEMTVPASMNDSNNPDQGGRIWANLDEPE